MPVYRHPRALEAVPGHPPSQVSLAREHYEVSGGTFATDDESAVRALADAYDVAVADLRVSDADDSADAGGPESASSTTDPATLIEQGECPWCDDYAGEHVGQHASSAHPEQWDAYTED